jgi:hypothetical protein
MFLTKKEEKILDGEKGPIASKAMRLLVTLGDINNARLLVSIKRSQISGVSYKTAGEPTLTLIERMAKENVRVKTISTLNPSGMDLNKWEEMGIKYDFAEKQLRLCNAYGKLGIRKSCTCTPYLSNNKPCVGEIVGFSESSAVAYVNSVIGARTNRHGGLDALSAAIIGKVPLMGYLLDENRRSNVLVKVKFNPKNETDYSLLGYYVGKKLKTGEVPVYDGISEADFDDLKLMGAASAASGSVAIFHVLGVTPDYKKESERNKAKLIVTRAERKNVHTELSNVDEPDLVTLGCPHCSLKELHRIAHYLSGKKVSREKKVWIFTSPKVFTEASELGIVDKIKSSGGDVFKHTCMVVMPLEDMGFKRVCTNSAKAAFYIPRMTKGKCDVGLFSLKECIRKSVY